LIERHPVHGWPRSDRLFVALDLTQDAIPDRRSSRNWIRRGSG